MLSDELWKKIFSFLPSSEILSTISLVCKDWNNLVNDGKNVVL